MDTNVINNDHESNSVDIKLKYNRYDKGPFIVIAEKENMNVYKLSRDLKINGFMNIEEIDQINQRKSRIKFKYWYDANKMLSNELLEYKTFVPEMFIFTVGVVRGIPLDIDTNDILMNSNINSLVKVERITRWIVETKTSKATETVKLTFRLTTLPDKIKIYNINSKLDYFIPSPIFCTNCLNYGHKKKFCKGLARCDVCSSPSVDPLTKENHICENNNICKHCGPGHKSNDFDKCSERKKQKKINRYIAVHKLSYFEASKLFKRNVMRIPSDEDFPNPKWKTPDKNLFSDELLKKNEDIANLRTDLKELVDFINNIQQMISSSSNSSSNDIILYEIGMKCNTINNKLKDKSSSI